MTSSRLRSLPSARRTCSPSPLPHTAIPAESYPRYSKRRSPSIMTGTTAFLPTYPTMPHIFFYSCFRRGDRLISDSEIATQGASIFEGVTKLLDDRIGKDFARDASDFRIRF